MWQAFEDLLPWGLFSLRMNQSLSAIASLPQTLGAVSDARIRQLREVLFCTSSCPPSYGGHRVLLSTSSTRQVLFCTWPRFVWLRHDEGASTPLPGASDLLRFDAFESIMWTLRKRLRGDIGWPSDWADGCAAVEKYFATKPPGVHGEWTPWRNHARGAFTTKREAFGPNPP
jgi:hypothetical protein